MYVSIPSTICDFLLSPEKKSVKTAFWWRPSSKKQDKKGHYMYYGVYVPILSKIDHFLLSPYKKSVKTV